MARARRPRPAIAALVCATVTLAAARAHADDAPPPLAQPPDDAPHGWNAAWEAAVVIAIPATYYWHTQSDQEVDWTLHWDWRSWKAKLDLSADRFDTNPFHVNAIRHPLTGVLDYHIGRTNGFDMADSTLLAAVTGIFWEYVVEYRENPAINDMVMNTIGGLAIGEPLYQLGQLWRGGDMTWGDYAASTLFSPFDTFHTVVHGWHAWWRPRAWRDFRFTLGGERTGFGGAVGAGPTTRTDMIVGADLEVIRHPAVFTDGPHAEPVEPGAWSRLTASVKLCETGGEGGIQATQFRTRTSIAGRYRADGDGDGLYYGVGAAFTYDRERLPAEWDRLAIGHLFGPQLELTSRSPRLTLRWELAGYVDFALVQAHAFGLLSPFPAPPPLYDTLQANGYYDAGGGSVTSRFRATSGPWDLDIEGSAHALYSLDFAQRVEVDTTARETNPFVDPEGVADQRIFWRAALSYRPFGGRYGATLSTDGVYRRGTWQAMERATIEHTTMLALTADL